MDMPRIKRNGHHWSRRWVNHRQHLVPQRPQCPENARPVSTGLSEVIRPYLEARKRVLGHLHYAYVRMKRAHGPAPREAAPDGEGMCGRSSDARIRPDNLNGSVTSWLLFPPWGSLSLSACAQSSSAASHVDVERRAHGSMERLPDMEACGTAAALEAPDVTGTAAHAINTAILVSESRACTSSLEVAVYDTSATVVAARNVKSSQAVAVSPDRSASFLRAWIQPLISAA